MYLPRHFEQSDAAALAALMRAHPLATLVTSSADGPDADPLPLLWDEATRTLRGHVARANPLWQRAAGQRVLAVFHGPQGYVSPSWYPSKARTHKVVPTWNYALVHAHGTLRAVHDAAWLRRLVGELTDTHEARQAQPWRIDDAPAEYLAQMLQAIVGIEIAVERLVGKFKLSQNRDTADRAGVQQRLAEGEAAAQALAAMMG